MTFNYDELGKHIAICRKLAGMTQAELAEKVDLSISMISSIETGKAKPSLASTARIAETLNTTIDHLVHMGATTSIEYYKQEWGARIDEIHSDDKPLAFEASCAIVEAIKRNRR